VLLLGESGTGKELLAREIHERSARRDKPFVKVNCGSIPRELFESEFFGHVKGAFTGATKDRLGRFQLADRGTLFLDEVGEIPFELQAKLLRVLQEGEFERVGDEKTTRVDVRVIAATNRDLLAEVRAGRFREDLYYRLSVFPIEIPPLRERSEDIPQLVAHFVELARHRFGRTQFHVTGNDLEQLRRYAWPGNVRELANVIERAAILSPSGKNVRVETLLARNEDVPAPEQPRSEAAAGAPFVTEMEWRQREKQNLLAALDQAGGKIFGPGGAAELLGMKPTTLASRLRALGIQRRVPR
jgi:transcriptional regulator with GAF, ATPase, and Fis domain